MKEIRSIIGSEKALHIQVTALDTEGMLKDADTILEKVDPDVYVKVPVTMEGIKAIRQTSVVIMKAKTADLTDTSIPKSKTEIAITAVSRMQQTTERPAALRRLLFQYVTRYATGIPTVRSVPPMYTARRAVASAGASHQKRNWGIKTIAARTGIKE